jgi:hypothetical protein
VENPPAKENIMKYRRLLLATVSAVVVMSAGLGASTAGAVDNQTFPGAMCIRNSDQPGGSAHFGNSARLFNTSTTAALNVICPIVRDTTTSPWLSVQVTVIDQHVSQNVSCRALSLSSDGNTTFQTSALSTSGNSSSGKVITFGPIGESDNGYHFLRCQLPPKGADASAVASYLISEF